MIRVMAFRFYWLAVNHIVICLNGEDAVSDDFGSAFAAASRRQSFFYRLHVIRYLESDMERELH